MKLIGVLAFMAFSTLAFLTGKFIEWIKGEKRMDKMEWQLNRMKAFYNLSMQWLTIKQEGQNLSEYFKFNGYNSIAIYGFSDLGQRLVDELQGTGVDVCYIVDQNADNIITKIPKYKPMDDLPKADVLVVTAIIAFQDIQETMEKTVDMPIVSLEDVVYGLA